MIWDVAFHGTGQKRCYRSVVGLIGCRHGSQVLQNLPEVRAYCLKIPHAWILEHKGIRLILACELHPCCLNAIRPEAAEEEKSSIVFPSWELQDPIITPQRSLFWHAIFSLPSGNRLTLACCMDIEGQGHGLKHLPQLCEMNLWDTCACHG